MKRRTVKIEKKDSSCRTEKCCFARNKVYRSVSRRTEIGVVGIEILASDVSRCIYVSRENIDERAGV